MTYFVIVDGRVQQELRLTDAQKATLAALRGPILKPTGRVPIGSSRAQVPIPKAVLRRP
jgi:hypothetical protein